jgi:uncharacterized protein YdeI (YjbR/CyaY-like superfamily)
MPKSEKNPKVDAFFKRNKKWPEEMARLREVVLESGQLTEELKWYQPCYTFQDSNIIILGTFKGFAALMFCKGALLKDPKKILRAPGANTQAARRAEFTSVAEIDKAAPILKAYIKEAIEAQRAGLQVEYKKTEEHKAPEELEAAFKEDPAFQKAFEALTPGRQRSWILQFAAPKQSKTREARIEKYKPDIFEGKGFNEDYQTQRTLRAKR